MGELGPERLLLVIIRTLSSVASPANANGAPSPCQSELSNSAVIRVDQANRNGEQASAPCEDI